MSATTATPKESVFSGVIRQLRGNLQTYALVVAMVAIWGLFYGLTSGAYLSPQNFSNLFRQMTVNALLSLSYILLARDCTIAAYAVGFDPYVGFFHQPPTRPLHVVGPRACNDCSPAPAQGSFLARRLLIGERTVLLDGVHDRNDRCIGGLALRGVGHARA